MKSCLFLKFPEGTTIGVRHLQSFFLFLCITLTYFLRINASLAVVAMTNRSTTNPNFEEFTWSIKEQSMILSSFFWTYMITQLPGGWVAQRYGAKWLLFTAMAIPSLVTLFVPMLVRFGSWKAMCAVRLVQGFFQGIIFPTMHSLLAKWAPFKERNRLLAFSQSGIEFGTVLAFTGSGYIAGSSIGWPGIFYISGGLGVIWSIIWMIFGANSPHECRYIHSNEIKHIEDSIKSEEVTFKKSKLEIPWKEIWLSVPFWALLITRCGQAWGFATLLSEIPTYMNSILEMHIQNNAIYSGLPYLVMLIITYLMIALADVIIMNNFCSLSVMRKSLNTIASFIPGIALISLGFVTKDNSVLAVCLIIIAVGTNGAHTIGSILNHIDLSPNHVGILLGITNTIGNIIALIVPLVFGAIVTEKSNLFQWRIIFCLAGISFIGSNIIYLIFGKMKVQKWNHIETIKQKSVQKSVEEEKPKFYTIDLRSV